MTPPPTLQDLASRLLSGAANEELLTIVEALQVAGSSFGELEARLRELADGRLPAEALKRLEAFLEEEFEEAIELSVGGDRYWTYLHHRHARDLGFGETVSLKAIGRAGHGLFLFCLAGDYPELEPYRVDDRHVFLGVEGRLVLGEEALARLVRRYELVPLFEETGGRGVIDRLTSQLLVHAPRTAISVAKTGAGPDTWRLAVGRGWCAEAVKAAEAMLANGASGSLARLPSG